jgi:hypothetical protein
VKNFIKSLFIAFLLFVSLSVQACGISQNVLVDFSKSQILTSTKEDVLVGVNSPQEPFVSQNNTRPCEIYSLSNKKDNYSGANFDKAALQNNFSQKFYLSYSKQILCNSFRKISPNLENEICTRAP